MKTTEINNVDRRKTGDVLFYALNCAISDRESLIDAYMDDVEESAVQSAMADIVAFKRLKRRLFGARQSMNEAIASSGKKVTLAELRNMIEVT